MEINSFVQMFSNPLIELLKKCDDAYTNSDEYYVFTEEDKDLIKDIAGCENATISTDDIYDRIYSYTKDRYGSDSYFQTVGAPVSIDVAKRGGKVPLPYKMGSMTEAHLGDLENWIQPMSEYTISAKLDGVSCMIIYKNGRFDKAYSRGDGENGADISRHLIEFDCVPKKINTTLPEVAVRGEVIIPKNKINQVIDDLLVETKKTYKNGRNLTAGRLNCEDTSKVFNENAHFVAYHIENWNKSEFEQFEQLKAYGFLTAKYWLETGNNIYDRHMIDVVTDIKTNYDYECDGVIITINKKSAQFEGMESGTLNPKASRKFKIGGSQESVISTIIGIEWNCSKDSYLKPRINIKPVDLNGVTISWCTGHNYGDVMTKHACIGAEVIILRKGDVIPYLEQVVNHPEQEDYQLPDHRLYKLNETGTDAVLVDFNECPYELQAQYQQLQLDQNLQQLAFFCSTMKVDQAGEANCRALMQEYGDANGFFTVLNLITLPVEAFESTIGANGVKFYISLHSRLKNVNPAVFFDATGTFGRGIGELKLMKLIERWGTLDLNYDQVLSTEGYAEKSAKQFIDHRYGYTLWVEFANNNPTILNFKYPDLFAKDDTYADVVAVFTGIRDANLQNKIVQGGGKVVSSCTNTCNLVIAKNPAENSGKLQKARERGVEIISYNEALERFM